MRRCFFNIDYKVIVGNIISNIIYGFSKVVIISEKNKAIDIYKSENEDLKKENKRLKTKNGLYNIISAIIIVPLTYLAITK